MRLLLDECTPRRLRRDFAGHTVSTVEEAGLKGLKNGELLKAAAAANFDALITVDQNIPHQQNISALKIAILILTAKSNRYQDLKLLAPKALGALKQIKPGEAVRVV
jgi:predicted nuclease of predicted toxin-antitoxin system